MPRDQVFISYSHEDTKWREALEKHLKPYVRASSIKGWSDRQIVPGSTWFGEIKSALLQTNVAVLLVTPAFLASDFIHEHELGPLLKEAERGGVIILWVPIYASAYKQTALEKYQAVLDPNKPLGSFSKAKRDEAWVKICEEIERAANPLSDRSLERVSSAFGPKAALSNIPDRNPFFTGRDQVLTQLREALLQRGRAALSGLGGIGKTQTAVEYAHRHSREYDYAFLVTADSREALISGYATIAGILRLPESDDKDFGRSTAQIQPRPRPRSRQKDQMVALDAVKRWFSSNQRWLLIFDNVAEPDSIKPFMPVKPTGHILLTSRAQVFDAIGIVKAIELNEMSREKAQAFLLKRTGRGDDGGVETNAASELTIELGFLPLALEQAGAFIVKNQSLFQDYLRSFRKRKLELLNKHGPVAGNYPESVRTTWSMNFRQLEKESEAAADLLRLSAFLSPDDIPLEFVAKAALELGNVLSAALVGAQEDLLVLDETLMPLRSFSLIRRDIETRSYSVHRLVQAVVRSELDLQTRRLWAERAVRAVNRTFPKVEFSRKRRCLNPVSEQTAPKCLS